MIHENGTANGKDTTKSHSKATAKKPTTSNLQSSISSQKAGPSLSDGGSSSPSKSAGMLEASNKISSKPKPVPEDLLEEANSKPVTVPRSQCNSKDRCTQEDKRLSLANSGPCSRKMQSNWPCSGYRSLLETGKLRIQLHLVCQGNKIIMECLGGRIQLKVSLKDGCLNFVSLLLVFTKDEPVNYLTCDLQVHYHRENFLNSTEQEFCALGRSLL